MFWAIALAVGLCLVAVIARRRVEARIDRAIARIESRPRAPALVRPRLPAPVVRYLERTGFPLEHPCVSVRVAQRGSMQLAEGKGWQDFVATQVFGVTEATFVWSAKFRAFRVVDMLGDAAGSLDARLFGMLPLAHAAGPRVTEAQLMRYLGEAVWAPPILAFQTAIEWREHDAHRVEATLHTGEHSVQLTFEFDAHGDIVRSSGTRARQVGKAHVDTPWEGLYADYRLVDGIRIPTRCEARWLLDSGSFPYWRGTMTSLAWR